MLYTLLACTATPLPGTTPITTGTTSSPTSDGTDTDTTPSDTEPTGPTGDTAPPLDCTTPPPIPAGLAPYDTFFGWGQAEDFDLDGEGYHVAVPSRDLRGRLPDGTTRVMSPNVSASPAGTRVMPDGDWIVADVATGSLVRVAAATGGQTTLLGGLSYPNGVEVGTDGYVFVAETDANRVRQVDAITGEQFEVTVGATAANGLILSPDEQILYIGSFGAGKVWGVPRLGPTSWGERFVLMDQDGFSGGFDGINVDACGNVYVTEYIRGDIWRITPDGAQVEKFVSLPSSWIPNLRWGHGMYGWETDILYVADRDQGRIFAVHAGIIGKTHVLAP
jgi:hypothetical protein